MSVRLANDGKKYAAVRLFGGALLSTFDLITDIYMIWTYYATGENAFAIASLISLFTNIIIQLALVYFQYRNHPSKSRIFTEMLYVLFAVKPGVDAYRVVLGEKWRGAASEASRGRSPRRGPKPKKILVASLLEFVLDFVQLVASLLAAPRTCT